MSVQVRVRMPGTLLTRENIGDEMRKIYIKPLPGHRWGKAWVRQMSIENGIPDVDLLREVMADPVGRAFVLNLASLEEPLPTNRDRDTKATDAIWIGVAIAIGILIAIVVWLVAR